VAGFGLEPDPHWADGWHGAWPVDTISFLRSIETDAAREPTAGPLPPGFWGVPP